MSTLAKLRKELRSKANSEQAEFSKRYFKTGPGEYGEGDVFLGLTIPTPELRKIAKNYTDLSFGDLQILLDSKFNEERQFGLMIMVHNFRKSVESNRKKLFNFYLKNTRRINNWNLVDLSAPKIIGEYLFGSINRTKGILYKLAKSKNIWERRIAIISTHAFIKENRFGETLKISEMLLKDEHDLIHKAVGWMLREVGKRSQKTEEKFLKKHYKMMPRTMLRYAIERFPEKKRKLYLNGKV